MLLDARFYIPYVIGEKIIRGTGEAPLRTAGESREMCSTIGILMMRDVLGKSHLMLLLKTDHD